MYQSLFFSAAFSVICLRTLTLSAQTNTIYATPDGGKAIYQGKSLKTETLNTAIKKARAGDTVLILPGTYNEEFAFEKIAGADEPLTIKGHSGLSIFACQPTARRKGKAALTVNYSRWLKLENLTFKDCWPHALKINESEYISVRGLVFSGSHQPIFVGGESSHHLLFEENSWKSGSAEVGEKSPDVGERALILVEAIAGALVLRNNILPESAQALSPPAHGQSGRFAKRPFITDVEVAAAALVLSFSESLKPATYDVAVNTPNGQFLLNKCRAAEQKLRCAPAATPLLKEQIEKIIIPDNIAGTDGGLITLWSEPTSKVSLRKATTTL